MRHTPMSSHHHNHAVPQGGVGGPGLLYGGVGLVLAMTMQMLGLFKSGDARLKKWLLEPVFHGDMPDTLVIPALILITAVFCFGLAFAILDSVGTWRRVILGITMMALTIAMVPTFAVWHVYFSPFVLLVGVFWTWFCTMMYVSHHVMPCDSLSFKIQTPNTKKGAPVEPVVKKVAAEAKAPTRKMVKKKTVKKQTKKKKEQKDTDAKYKPKEKKVDG